MGMPSATRAPRERLLRAMRSDLTRVLLPAASLLALLIAGMSVLLVQSQEHSRDALEQRYALRATLASRFVAAYVEDIQKREGAYAGKLLAGRVVSQGRFALFSGGFGFRSAALLDAHGRALNTLPERPALIGRRLDTRYPYLRAAIAGHPAVSDVIPSAGPSGPIVAIAVPFDTPFGRRVFTGAARIGDGPLAAFLADLLPYKGARSYLVDAAGNLIGAGGSTGLAPARPPWMHAGFGRVVLDGTEFRYVSVPIADSPWRLLTLAPSSELFAPVSDIRRLAPWFVLLAFGLASGAALVLLAGLMRRKAELSHLAMHDPLTGALNRRALERAFERLSVEASRSTGAVGVVAIDLDRFKDVNDMYGHAGGDAALCQVAETLWVVVRPSDIVARSGGDEFVVLLADVSEAQAVEVGSRVFRALEDSTFAVAEGGVAQGSSSVGIAVADHHDTLEMVLARADRALYEAKAAGKTVYAPRPNLVSPARPVVRLQATARHSTK
jgi:diguanylate cyclase (GGDEF)-like protein